jgi:hypothetical protein
LLPDVVEDETLKFTFAASSGIPASMNVCGCSGDVPVTHLNWAFALDGGAIVSGGMPMGVKEAVQRKGWPVTRDWARPVARASAAGR